MEEIKPTLTAPLDVKPVDTPVDTKAESKPADKPVESAAKATDSAKPAADDKSKPAEDAKPEAKVEKPSETLLDEASEEEKTDKDTKSAVPEKYDFKLPEGMTLDEAKIKAAEPLFKELGLNNDQAQKLVDLQLQLNKANEETHVQAWEAFVETQKQESKSYFGTKLPEVMRNVARARNTFIPKNLQEKLNVAGFSNDKDFLEALDKVGRVIGEGKFVSGKQSAPAKGDGSIKVEGASLADVYPSMATK